jgi:hypothetical protein
MRKALIFSAIAAVLLLGFSFSYQTLHRRGQKLNQTVHEIGNFITAGLALRQDGRWWNCTGAVTDGSACSAESVASLPLEPDEKALMGRLDVLPAPPGPITEADLTAAFGRPPDGRRSKESLTISAWVYFRKGVKGANVLQVYEKDGHLSQIYWIGEPDKRFYLVKQYPPAPH